MKKVITYGTFDFLHYGHINLLQRAKEVGDYLIVGITTEDFDVNRGKLNVQQSLMERISAVKETNLADEIILEEYQGQKIDDIKKYNIDVFAIGSDWVGKFDYLKEYCQAIYLERTKGISSTKIREGNQFIDIGILGYDLNAIKFIEEIKFVSGIDVKGICAQRSTVNQEDLEKFKFDFVYDNYDDLLQRVDAVYITIAPNLRYEAIKKALMEGKHVLSESPISLLKEDGLELYELAFEKGVVLFEGIKTAYALAFNRLVLLIKAGIIGEVKLVDATCTSLESSSLCIAKNSESVGSLMTWGSTALLAIFKIFGIEYKDYQFKSFYAEDQEKDLFTRLELIYDHAIGTINVGLGVNRTWKSLVLSIFQDF